MEISHNDGRPLAGPKCVGQGRTNLNVVLFNNFLIRFCISFKSQDISIWVVFLTGIFESDTDYQTQFIHEQRNRHEKRERSLILLWIDNSAIHEEAI